MDAILLWYCHKCGSPTPGVTLMEIDGRVYLNVSGLLVSQAWRHCHVCGEKTFWKQPKMTLAELASRQMARAASEF